MKHWWRLGVVAFVGGFVLMTYELVAARLMAPSIGNSTYVWTGVIGVIIMALSLGYWLGGRVADKRQSAVDVAWLLLSAAAMVVFTLLATDNVMSWLAETRFDARIQAVLAAILLFAPASFLLGAVSPYLAKLNVTSLETAGRAVANLGALDAIGGICGTFVTGFFLFGIIGSRETLVLLAVILVATSWLMTARHKLSARAFASAAVIVAAFATNVSANSHDISIDTPSAHYSIVNFNYNGRTMRGLVTGPSGIQSGIYLDNSGDLPFWYTQQMTHLMVEAQPSRVLLLGGGAFTMAENLAQRLPNSQIDVVEIDPALEQISEQYFGYTHPSNVQLHFEDARTFIQHADAKYDMVLVDVYGDGEIPYSLLTAEYGQELTKIVREDGLVVVNLIAGLQTSSPCRALFEAFDAAYRQSWPQAWYATQNPTAKRANYVVAYSANAQTTPSGLLPLSSLNGKLYTDNFIPSDQLYASCENS